LLVGFQGEHGAYSEQAIKRFLGNDHETVPFRSFPEMLRAVEDERVDNAILPVENSLAGTVMPAYDALMNCSLLVQAEIISRVEHCLMAPAETVFADVKYAISHHQALAQCSNNLLSLGIEPREYYDTAGAAKDLAANKTPGTAAIASELAAETYGLTILKRNLEDLKINYTRFFLMGREAVKCSGRCKTSIIFTTQHLPGALYRVLGELSNRALNMTKIESRPSRREMWHYLFFVGFEGAIGDRNVDEALEAIERQCSYFKLLGSYPAAEAPKIVDDSV
jgi:prephenate dehydratase